MDASRARRSGDRGRTGRTLETRTVAKLRARGALGAERGAGERPNQSYFSQTRLLSAFIKNVDLFLSEFVAHMMFLDGKVLWEYVDAHLRTPPFLSEIWFAQVRSAAGPAAASKKRRPCRDKLEKGKESHTSI